MGQGFEPWGGSSLPPQHPPPSIAQFQLVCPSVTLSFFTVTHFEYLGRETTIIGNNMQCKDHPSIIEPQPSDPLIECPVH